MDLVSWNVNGLRASMDKGMRDWLTSRRPEVACFQETKALPNQVDLSWIEALGYEIHWNPAGRKGYSGTMILTTIPPREVTTGLGIPEHDTEGRVIRAEFDDFQLVNVYTPNSQRGLARLDYRQQWDRDFRDYLVRLDQKKPVVFCGDLNCAHQEIDLANPAQNRRNAGFTDEERTGLTGLFDAGFEDSFRKVHGPAPNRYSWWTYRSDARARNIGWRLDYFGVSHRIGAEVKNAEILDQVFGSDHCPVTLTLR